MPELNGWKIIKNIIDPSIRSNPEDVSFSHILLIIKNITDLLLWAAGIAALFMILWGGIQYITAYGDEGKAENAKKILTWSIVGVIVVMLARIILQYVGSLLGYTIPV